jgi:hypothetical protein
VFLKSDGSAIIFSGSNNLTRGGLVANTEYAVREEVVPTEFPARKGILDAVAATPDAVGNVTDALLRDLRQQRQAEVKAIRASAAPNAAAKVAAESDLITRVVMLMVPGGGRWSQVAFRADIMLEFFGLDPTHRGPVRLQQVQPGHLVGPIEVRNLIRPPRNQNSRLEFGGFQNKQYPTTGKRPILIAEEMGNGLFRYTCLMPGEKGHRALERHLETLPTRHRAMPQEITSVARLLDIWPDYPV